MTDSAKAPDEQDDARQDVDTGRRGQRLIVEGWFASHADSGTPGPHIHLRTSDKQDPVLRTDQVPSLITALTTVGERIDAMWVTHGDQYAADVVLPSPDPQVPRVIQQRLRKRLGRSGGWNNSREVRTDVRTCRDECADVPMRGRTSAHQDAWLQGHGRPVIDELNRSQER